MWSKIHSRKLTAPQPTTHVTDYYWLVSSLVRYFGPKSGGHLYRRAPFTEIRGTRPLRSCLWIQPCDRFCYGCCCSCSCCCCCLRLQLVLSVALDDGIRQCCEINMIGLPSSGNYEKYIKNALWHDCQNVCLTAVHFFVHYDTINHVLGFVKYLLNNIGRNCALAED